MGVLSDHAEHPAAPRARGARALIRASLLCSGWLGAAVLLPSCAPPPRDLSWMIELESSALLARTAVVRTEILEGGCAGTARYSADVRPGEDAPLPPVLARGRWGFSAEAYDTDCVLVADDCDELELPGPTRIASLLRGAAAIPACSPSECSSGSCARPDAGVPSDAGPARDAQWPDTGPRDGGPALLPYLPCGGTTVEGIDRYFEVVAGSVSHVPLVHRDGICPSDCTDEVLRLESGTTIEGHFAFASTFAVLAARQSGAGSVVIEVCGAPFSSDDLAGSGTAGLETWPDPPRAVPSAGECPFRITASGGPISIYRFDLDCRTPSAPPVVDVKVNEMDGVVTLAAPATTVVSWSSTEATSCVGSGDWAGPRPTVGSSPLLDLPPGRWVFGLECTNALGTGTDTAILEVTP